MFLVNVKKLLFCEGYSVKDVVSCKAANIHRKCALVLEIVRNKPRSCPDAPRPEHVAHFLANL